MISISLVVFSACHDRDKSIRKATEDYERKRHEEIVKENAHKAYIDSLVDVATGLYDETDTDGRRHALVILWQKYPQMSDKWEKVSESIDNMDVYGCGED